MAIARALWDWESARVLVVDEPTASLPREEVATLFAALGRVRAAGLGVIYVSHRLDEIFAIGDRVTVLRDGQRVGCLGRLRHRPGPAGLGHDRRRGASSSA